MAKVLFITTDYYKSNTVTSDQVGDKVLSATIADAQSMYIEPLLGTRLYEALKTKIIGGTLTGDYLTLMNDYVVITLLKWVEHDLFYMNNYKNRNKGVSTKNSENATTVSFNELNFLMEKAERKANFYGMKLVDYLICNSNLFPEYCESDEGGEIAPVRSAAKTGMYLGNAKRNYYTKKDAEYWENKRR
jgi:hypothetical protein